ncbi:hypothetical protein TanjilG_24399 [Lupinus angustifolius]|uniref:Pectinesterase inhibitor domain-containing protein n=2 Tax=Lupinus angustifolius TaxID=3871 RepID=A0A1J7FMV7_LUPAN|nr:hypothetical protein TanjilG_24399 [Lupinus angustifolius]
MAASGKSLYEGVCRETQNPAGCLQLLRHDPQITSAKNYFDLSRFILEFGEKKATEGKEYILQIAKEHPTPQITLCAKNTYGSLPTSFIIARDEMINDPKSATYDALVIGDGPAYCAEAFRKANVENPPINKMMTLLSHIAYYAIEHLT